jgi:hypothetical protein
MAPRVTCRIDGKEVSREEFDRFLDTLRQTDGWYCDETTAGGETGWNAEDASGAKFTFKAVQDGGTSTLEIERQRC